MSSLTDPYAVPDAPADPEHAALDLIVRLPREILHVERFTDVLQEYCSLLHAEGCFAGLSWRDAKQVAVAVSFDVCARADAQEFLHGRARNVLAGRDGMTWDDRDGAARALTVAAQVLAL